MLSAEEKEKWLNWPDLQLSMELMSVEKKYNKPKVVNSKKRKKEKTTFDDRVKNRSYLLENTTLSPVLIEKIKKQNMHYAEISRAMGKPGHFISSALSKKRPGRLTRKDFLLLCEITQMTKEDMEIAIKNQKYFPISIEEEAYLTSRKKENFINIMEKKRVQMDLHPVDFAKAAGKSNNFWLYILRNQKDISVKSMIEMMDCLNLSKAEKELSMTF